jgi:signal transduction histidine kinase
MEEVLVLSKVEAGQMAFKPEEIDLPKVCRRLTDEVLSATHRQCPILLDCAALPTALADEGLLRHILTNLLSNAVKYSSAGSPVELRLFARDRDAVFIVRDEGLGIPAPDQERLFKAFHRGQNAGQVPGTGLGLSIVKRCVELHGGKITFQSEEGKGTTFTVTLPVFAARAQIEPTTHLSFT